MATTTNYAWETPDDTDLVKDGAAAIRTLGSSIDTTTKALNPSTTLGDIEYRSSTANTNTRLGIGTSGQVLTVSGGGVPSWATASAGALTKITTSTFTAAAGVNVNNCFSATYKRYLVLFKAIATTGSAQLHVKLRASGTDLSSAYYYAFATSLFSGATPAALGANNGTAGFPSVTPTTGYTTAGSFTFYSPFEAANTVFSQQSLSIDSGGLNIVGSGVALNTTSYDGFSLVFASGNYTGEVVVYGYSD